MRKVFFLLLLGVLSVLGYYLNSSHIYFVDDVIRLSIGEDIEPYRYIKNYYHVNADEIVINSTVENNKCGKYVIEYQFHNKIKTLNVIVEDTISPTFETINKKILLNETIKPEEMVIDVKDQSNTKVYFKDKYIFDKEKTYSVDIVVEDEYKNKTIKKAYILVESKDNEPPVLQGVHSIEVIQGQKLDLIKGIVRSDDHDPYPELVIDDSLLNLDKVGDYNVIYTVKDKSGNQSVYNRKISVRSRYSNIEAKKDGIKTCYLTFDDGPSYNTPKVLDILDDYGIKASFFITGTHSDSYQYIEEIKDRGHTIGLHSYSHDYEKIYTSLSSYMKDLEKVKKLVKEKAGVETNFIRFPGGSSNLVSKKYNVGIMKRLTKKVIDEGYQYYDWTCVNGDGENIKTVKGLVKKAKEEIADLEDIMFLMHDSTSHSTTVEALPIIIEYLQDKGYEFKAIDETSPTFHHTVQN